MDLNSFKEKLLFLPYNDFFSSVQKSFETLTTKIQGISLAIVVACIVVTGLMFLFGEGPSRAAKKWLLYIILGATVIFGATTFGDTIKSVGGF